MNAQWITCPGYNPEQQCFFYARREWEIGKVEKPVFAKISADSRYRFYLNGNFVGAGPVRGSATLNFYDELEITPYLREGKNEAFFEVYSLLDENYAMNSLVPALIAEIPGMIATDETFQVQLDKRWKLDVPWFTKQLGKIEFCDLRVKPGNDWLPAVPVTEPRHLAKKLQRNPLPARNKKSYFPGELSRIYEISHDLPEDPYKIPHCLHEEAQFPLRSGRVQNQEVLLSAPRHGRGTVISPGDRGVGMIVNFDREISGCAEILMDAPSGTQVQISYAECLVNNRVKTRFSMVNYNFTDCFILDEGENLLTTRFNERGFRMLQISIRNFDRPVTIRKIEGVDLRYPFSPRSSFFCSDALLNRINEVCMETISACTSDVITDCPWRERAFWTNDFVVNNLVSLTCFGAEEVHRHCFELMFSQKHESGLIPAVVPQQFYTRKPRIFLATNLYVPLMLMDYLLYSGDCGMVKQYLPDVEQILDTVWGFADEEGILSCSGLTAGWNFFDWSFDSNGYYCSEAKESMLSSLFVIAVKTLEQLALFTGYPYDPAKNRSRRERTAANLEKRFVDSEKGWIVEDFGTEDNVPVQLSTQLAHALWLLTGEASKERIPAFVEALNSEACLKPDYYLHCFWFRAAAMVGMEQIGLERIRKYWGRCIATGSPTLYEVGIHGFGVDGINGSGSLCHAFGTIPVNFFQQIILGVTPVQPGFKEFTFAPRLFDLEFAQGRIPVPDGKDVRVRITKQDYELVIPEGCVCRLPDGTLLAAGPHAGPMESLHP